MSTSALVRTFTKKAIGKAMKFAKKGEARREPSKKRNAKGKRDSD
jgi:hypothetical protein